MSTDRACQPGRGLYRGRIKMSVRVGVGTGEDARSLM